MSDDAKTARPSAQDEPADEVEGHGRKVERPGVSDEGDEVEGHGRKVERPGVSDEGDEVEAHKVAHTKLT